MPTSPPPPEADFTPFDADRYRELVDVPPAHLAYLREQQAREEPALAMVFVPHVLVVGPVDVSGLPREPAGQRPE